MYICIWIFWVSSCEPHLTWRYFYLRFLPVADAFVQSSSKSLRAGASALSPSDKKLSDRSCRWLVEAQMCCRISDHLHRFSSVCLQLCYKEGRSIGSSRRWRCPVEWQMSPHHLPHVRYKMQHEDGKCSCVSDGFLFSSPAFQREGEHNSWPSQSSPFINCTLTFPTNSERVAVAQEAEPLVH